MKAKNIDLQAAADFVGIHFEELLSRYLSARTRVQSFGEPVDTAVSDYIEAIGHWVRGNLECVLHVSLHPMATTQSRSSQLEFPNRAVLWSRRRRGEENSTRNCTTASWRRASSIIEHQRPVEFMHACGLVADVRNFIRLYRAVDPSLHLTYAHTRIPYSPPHRDTLRYRITLLS